MGTFEELIVNENLLNRLQRFWTGEQGMVFSSAQGEKKPLGLELEYVEKLAQIERLPDFLPGSACKNV